MSITHITDHDLHRRPGETEVDTAARSAGELVAALVSGDATAPRGPLQPMPVAFLDDGRRVFLLIDRGRPGSREERPADKPRSWGIEVASDGDLVDATPSRVAVRSTRRLTPQAAARAVRYALDATA